MSKKFKSEMTLKNGEGKFLTHVVFTNEAIFGCKDGSIFPEVAADSIRMAQNYIISKESGERFTIVDPLLRMVVIGTAIKDDKDIDIIVTNVYSDIYIINDMDRSDYITV